MTEPAIAKAAFMAATDENGREIPEAQRQRIEAHFNPETLDITYTNTVRRGNRNQPAQMVGEATAKLSMELIFDTSMSGDDVRMETHRIAHLMDPAQRSPRRRNAEEVRVPSIVVFQWGTIRFEGYMDSYKERVEFFSPEGVPLRAVVNLSLTQQQRSFSPQQNPVGGGDRQNTDLDLSVQPLGQDENMTESARMLGDTSAARTLATQNGIENLRHPEVAEIVVGRPVRFGVEAAAGTGPSGLSVSLGPTEAQFSGLRHPAEATANLNPTADLSLDAGVGTAHALSLKGRSGFGLGGEVGSRVGAGLTADVGLDADIELGIQFEE